MHKNLYSMTILALLLSGCAAINMSHYQDGKSMGKNNIEVTFGAGVGLSYDTDTTKLDDTHFNIETEGGPSLLFLSGAARAGVTPRLDFGAELFTTIGSTGFKFYGKYEITDTLSRWGMALMPVAGFSFPWFDTDDEDEDDWDIGSDEVGFSARTAILEMNMPMSYKASDNVTFLFSPQVHLHFNYISQTGGGDAEFKRKGKRTYLSPGASLGIRLKKVCFELTAVHFNDREWMPFFGISYFKPLRPGEVVNLTE